MASISNSIRSVLKESTDEVLLEKVKKMKEGEEEVKDDEKEVEVDVENDKEEMSEAKVKMKMKKIKMKEGEEEVKDDEEDKEEMSEEELPDADAEVVLDAEKIYNEMQASDVWDDVLNEVDAMLKEGEEEVMDDEDLEEAQRPMSALEKQLKKEITKKYALIHYYEKAKKAGTKYNKTKGAGEDLNKLKRDLETIKNNYKNLRKKGNKSSLKKEGEEEDMLVLNKESFDVSSDLEAIFGNDETLSEDFKNKVSNVFKSVVIAKANDLIRENVKYAVAEIEELYEAQVKKLTKELNSYASLVVENWKEENKVVLTESFEADNAKSFLNGIRILFEQHNIEIPAGKEDLFKSVIAENEALEARVNEELNEKVKLAEEAKELKKQIIIMESAKDLSDNQKEKLLTLAENVQYDNKESFTKAIESLKESYFSNKKLVKKIEEQDAPVILKEEKVIAYSEIDAVRDAIKRINFR